VPFQEVKRRRKLALQRTYHRCIYCGQRGHTVDHYYPRELGGSDDVDNLFAACRSCNSCKGPRPLHEARHVMALLVLGWPPFTIAEMAWLRERGLDLTEYDGFRFYFETSPMKCMQAVREAVGRTEAKLAAHKSRLGQTAPLVRAGERP
jgi:hypothetical protein